MPFDSKTEAVEPLTVSTEAFRWADYYIISNPIETVNCKFTIYDKRRKPHKRLNYEWSFLFRKRSKPFIHHVFMYIIPYEVYDCQKFPCDQIHLRDTASGY